MAWRDPAYLRELVLLVIGDTTTPTAVRNECHRLMFAINGNNLKLVEETVPRVERLAVTAGIRLPTAKPAQRRQA